MALAACFLFTATLALSGAPTITGPTGLNLSKMEPPEPFFERMLTNNRLNLRLYITNGTGGTLTYQQGTAVFRNAGGGVMRTSPLSAAEFLRRSTLVGASGFAGGMVITDVSGFTGERIVSAVLDQQNRIIVAGTGRLAGVEVDTILARYTSDGVLDRAFDGNGLLAAGSGYASAVAVDARTNVWVTGTLLSGNGFFLRAYDATGDQLWTPSQEFSGLSVATALAIDSQGRVVVGGATLTNGGFRFFLARYLTNAAPDLAFGTGGVVFPDFPTASHEGLNALAIDSSDRIVAAGWASVGGLNQFAVSRHLASNGSFDNTFSGDGRVLTTFPAHTSAQARALKISPSGRILVGGEARSGTSYRMALARYDTDGLLDPNFSADGLVVINAPTENEYISDIELDVIGRITVTGRAWNEEEEKLAIVRLNGIGQLDNAFSGDGILLAEGPPDWASASARSVMVMPDDDIVVAGHAESDEDHNDTRFALARFRPSGSSSVLPIASMDLLDLLDFPFYAALDGEDWQDFNAQLLGFDSKQTPAQLDLTLQFLEHPEPFTIKGIALAVYEQNPQPFRMPLVPAQALSWKPNHNRIYGSKHASSRSQRFAYDLSIRSGTDPAVDPNRDPQALGLPALYESLDHPGYDPNATYTAGDFSECYYAYGLPVLAVGSGTVVCVATNSLDNFPVGEGGTDGNGVVVEHADREFMLYAHLARGSVLVKTGDVVQAGTPLGRLGNSGSSSAPHLHMHYARLDDSQPALFCSGEGDNSTLGWPTYFNNVFFPMTTGGPSVRQLRSAIPPLTSFTVDTNPIPYNSIVVLHGPGLLNETPAHDTLAGPMQLRLPVSVQGSVLRATGSSLADGGDSIEDVFRFTVARTGTLSAQLLWNSSADLDMILYDQNLQPIQPAAAKTLARPELLCATLSPGTYYLFVSYYDPAPGPSAASYQLDLGIYTGGRDIYVDKASVCPTPFGTLNCVANWGGEFPTVLQGNNAVCPTSRMFIRAGTYPESVVFREPVVVRSYDGTAVINP